MPPSRVLRGRAPRLPTVLTAHDLLTTRAARLASTARALGRPRPARPRPGGRG